TASICSTAIIHFGIYTTASIHRAFQLTSDTHSATGTHPTIDIHSKYRFRQFAQTFQFRTRICKVDHFRSGAREGDVCRGVESLGLHQFREMIDNGAIENQKHNPEIGILMQFACEGSIDISLLQIAVILQREEEPSNIFGALQFWEVVRYNSQILKSFCIFLHETI